MTQRRPAFAASFPHFDIEFPDTDQEVITDGNGNIVVRVRDKVGHTVYTATITDIGSGSATGPAPVSLPQTATAIFEGPVSAGWVPSTKPSQNNKTLWVFGQNGECVGSTNFRAWNGGSGSGAALAAGAGAGCASAVAVALAPAVWSLTVAGFRGGLAELFHGRWFLELADGLTAAGTWDNGGDGDAAPRIELTSEPPPRALWRLRLRRGGIALDYTAPPDWDALGPLTLRADPRAPAEVPPALTVTPV